MLELTSCIGYQVSSTVDSSGRFLLLSINAIINAANRKDRFKLLEDDGILPANITNPIHPLFAQLEGEDQLQLALQLASQFLLHDRLLEFFVPLLYGREMYDLQTMKNFLCDPLVHASKARQAQLLTGVRQALKCLAKHIIISFVDQKQKRVCCSVFQGTMSPAIELSDKFISFYKDPQGYAQASRCAQFRHDFLFAATLVHELVHAVGVMRRGNTLEPCYRLDYPETEWGYAWENFMFGSIFNPQDKDRPGTHILMRKVWADPDLADERGGKEYCDVSMSWVGQWFRTETWNIVAAKGPTAIAPPTTHFKVQANYKLGAWVVSSDSPEVGKDIAILRRQRKNREKNRDIIQWKKCNTVELQGSNVPVPLRAREPTRPSVLQKLISSATTRVNTKKLRPTTGEMPPSTTAPCVPAYRSFSPCGIQRKRYAEAESDEDSGPKQVKRSRS